MHYFLLWPPRSALLRTHVSQQNNRIMQPLRFLQIYGYDLLSSILYQRGQRSQKWRFLDISFCHVVICSQSRLYDCSHLSLVYLGHVFSRRTWRCMTWAWRQCDLCHSNGLAVLVTTWRVIKTSLTCHKPGITQTPSRRAWQSDWPSKHSPNICTKLGQGRIQRNFHAMPTHKVGTVNIILRRLLHNYGNVTFQVTIIFGLDFMSFCGSHFEFGWVIFTMTDWLEFRVCFFGSNSEL